MHITQTGMLAFLLTVIVVVSVFGGHFYYTVNGVPTAQGVSANAPGILGVVGWVWQSVSFFFAMSTFSVTGMPAFLSGVFLVMDILAVYLLLQVVRGDGG